MEKSWLSHINKLIERAYNGILSIENYALGDPLWILQITKEIRKDLLNILEILEASNIPVSKNLKERLEREYWGNAVRTRFVIVLNKPERPLVLNREDLEKYNIPKWLLSEIKEVYFLDNGLHICTYDGKEYTIVNNKIEEVM